MSCENACYEAIVNGCSDITLKAGLAATTAYYVQINKASNSNVHQRQITAESDGSLIIQKASFPAGFFTPGNYKLSVRLASNFTKQALIFNTISFNCVLFKIVNTDIETDDTSPISVIQ